MRKSISEMLDFILKEIEFNLNAKSNIVKANFEMIFNI